MSPLLKYVDSLTHILDADSVDGEQASHLLDSIRDGVSALESDLRSLKAQSEPSSAASLVGSLRSQIDDLKIENADLRIENENITKLQESTMAQVRKLKEEAGEREWHEHEHDQKQREIMVLMGEKIRLCEPDVVKAFNFSSELAKHYIASLKKKGFIQRTEGNPNHLWVGVDRRAGPMPYWGLSDEGRAYLASRGLLK